MEPINQPKHLRDDVRFADEAPRVHCTRNVDGRPCPYHEPDVYAKYAARHRDGLLVSNRRIRVPEQRSPGDLPNGWQ